MTSGSQVFECLSLCVEGLLQLCVTRRDHFHSSSFEAILTRNTRLHDATITFAFQADEIAETIKAKVRTRLFDVTEAVSRGLDLVRLKPQQAAMQIGQTVGAVLERVATDTTDTLELFTRRASFAYPRFLANGVARETVLTDLIDPFDLSDLDGDGDSFFSDIADFYGLTEEEARALFEDFLVLGLLSRQWWLIWLQRQRVNVIQRVNSRLWDIGLNQEVPDDFFGAGGLSERQKSAARHAVHDALLGNDSRSAISTASSLVTTQVAALTNAVIQETVQKNPERFQGFLWSAVLDTRVCVRCGAKHGTVAPLDGALPPLHPNCRCTLLPLLVGQDIPDGITFSQWLKGKSSDVQDSILGKQAGEMFRDGKIKINQMVQLRGRYTPRQRTLRELLGE